MPYLVALLHNREPRVKELAMQTMRLIGAEAGGSAKGYQ